ncbi:MAG: hypothetical protein IT379_42945 [Deltaproteobacteria bacterium]|nr:hypothetical protein [Deltaproteobacteria bacterium]
MSDLILLGTRKGTVVLDRENGRWKPRPIAHAGMSISYAARDPRDGTMWAAMDLAHWGPKLSRSKDGGATWEMLTQIAYPEGARFVEQHLPSPGEDPSVEKPTTYKPATLLRCGCSRSVGPISREPSTRAPCRAGSSRAATAATRGS